MKVGNIEVVNNWWISGKDTVGIVLGHDVVIDRYNYYIGTTQEFIEIPTEDGNILVSNQNTEDEDIIYIINWGAKLSTEAVADLFSNILTARINHDTTPESSDHDHSRGTRKN